MAIGIAIIGIAEWILHGLVAPGTPWTGVRLLPNARPDQRPGDRFAVGRCRLEPDRQHVARHAHVTSDDVPDVFPRECAQERLRHGAARVVNRVGAEVRVVTADCALLFQTVETTLVSDTSRCRLMNCAAKWPARS